MCVYRNQLRNKYVFLGLVLQSYFCLMSYISAPEINFSLSYLPAEGYPMGGLGLTGNASEAVGC